MRSKGKLTIGIIVIIVVTIILILVLTVSKERKENKNNMEIIRKNYNLLTTSINKYNEIRTKFNEMSSVLLIDSYKNKHEEFVILLDDYNKEMTNIDTFIDNINFRCQRTYNDSEIDKICTSYKNIYEKLVNLYVSDIDNYNNFITEYNKNKNESLETIAKIHDEYIDYNGDGTIYGGVNNES